MLVGKGRSGEPSRTTVDRSTLSKLETGQLADPGLGVTIDEKALERVTVRKERLL